MKIIMEGDANEIAALIAALQGQAVSVDMVAEEMATRLAQAASNTFS